MISTKEFLALLVVCHVGVVNGDASVTWSSSNTNIELAVKFGDVVSLSWVSSSDVREVTPALFEACQSQDSITDEALKMGTYNIVKDIQSDASVDIVVTDVASTVRYFISSVGDTCQNGYLMKLSVTARSGEASSTPMKLPTKPNPDENLDIPQINVNEGNLNLQAMDDIMFFPAGVSIADIKASIEALRADMNQKSVQTTLMLREKLDQLYDDIKIMVDERVSEIETTVGTSIDDITFALEEVGAKVNVSVVDITESLRETDEDIQEQVAELTSELASFYEFVERPTSCRDIFENNRNPFFESMEYTIFPDGKTPVRVYCEMSKHDVNLHHNPDNDNIAKGKPTEQSSLNSVWVSSLAVDGNNDPIFNQGKTCTHTLKESKPWWRVDLQSEYFIQKIVITNRADCCSERLSRVDVRLSRHLDPTNAALDPQCTPGVLHNLPAGTSTIECKVSVPARFVTIMLQKTDYLTLCEVEIYGEASIDGALGWTVIASQTQDDELKGLEQYYNMKPPTPLRPGALEYFMKTDLKQVAEEMYVETIDGEFFIFNLTQFTGPLIIDGPNFVDAYDVAWRGIIAGGDSPVLNHYQVGQKCSQADCHEPIVSGPSYSAGDVMIVFDWQSTEGSTNVNQHAHFGGSTQIEQSWAKRGKVLMIR